MTRLFTVRHLSAWIGMIAATAAGAEELTPLFPGDSLDGWEIRSGFAEYGLAEKNKEAYEYASSLRLAGNLKGKLLLIHGASDRLVPFSHTMKMVEALIRASKPYDRIVLPEQGHVFAGTGEKYWREAIRRYFQEHLKP